MESNFAKANYYSVIAVKSYDKAIVKNEAIYILFQHNGMPKLRYLSVENINSANAKVVQRVLQSLKMMFEWIVVKNFEDYYCSFTIWQNWYNPH